MSKVYIYALKCPVADSVMYVGKTINVASRYKSHLNNGTSTKVKEWITSLRNDGQKPAIEVLEECDESQWEEREKYWIANYGLGNLLNTYEGGKHKMIFNRPSWAGKIKKKKTDRLPQSSGSTKAILKASAPAVDFINFVGISTHLTGSRDNIRKDAIPKKHRADVKELTDFVEYWIKKHSK